MTATHRRIDSSNFYDHCQQQHRRIDKSLHQRISNRY